MEKQHTHYIPCNICGGSGEEILGENRVTLDMAIDAGDRSMEGMFHSYATAECHACEGTGIEPHDNGEDTCNECLTISTS